MSVGVLELRQADDVVILAKEELGTKTKAHMYCDKSLFLIILDVFFVGYILGGVNVQVNCSGGVNVLVNWTTHVSRGIL